MPIESEIKRLQFSTHYFYRFLLGWTLARISRQLWKTNVKMLPSSTKVSITHDKCVYRIYSYSSICANIALARRTNSKSDLLGSLQAQETSGIAIDNSLTEFPRHV